MYAPSRGYKILFATFVRTDCPAPHQVVRPLAEIEDKYIEQVESL
jgi:hypothetical protein